jgi:cytochrome c oxidase subunit II
MSTAPHSAAAPSREGVAHGRRLVALWLVLSAVATPLVAIFLGPAIPPGNGSTQATEQTFDNQVMVSLVTPVCVLVVLFLVYTLISFRSSGAEVVDGPPIHGDSGIQIAWVLVTTVTVLCLAGFGTYELLQSGSGGGQGPTAAFLPSGHSKAMDVQVIAQQWEFTYRYPTYGGVETPHLMLPADTLIRLHVTSLDAVHSCWAYQLGIKADANPGTDNIAYVETKGPRSFAVHCAELCGLWHGYMFDTGQVVPAADFAIWIKQQQAYFAPVMKYLPAYSTAYLPDPQLRAG